MCPALGGLGPTAASLLQSALDHADAGYPVIPLVGKRPLGRMRASAGLGTVEAWWHSHPLANVGVSLNGLRVVVFDTGGPRGEAAGDALQEQAGAVLPATY